MRVLKHVQLKNYAAFRQLEAYDPMTIYYWNDQQWDGEGEQAPDWISSQEDHIGAAIVLDGLPMMLPSERLIEELVTKQRYTTEQDVRRWIAESASGGADKDKTLLSDSWNTLGPIANSRIAHCFQGEAHWAGNSTGKVSQEGFQTYLEGPASIQPVFDDPDAAIVSEPIAVRVEFQFAKSIYTYETPLLIIAPMGMDNSRIIVYGNPASGTLTASCEITVSGKRSAVEGEITMPQPHGGKVLDFLFFPQGVQAMSDGNVVTNNQMFMDRYPSVDTEFTVKLGPGVAIRWLNITRIRSPLAVN